MSQKFSLKDVSPEVAGIFWITEKPLSTSLSYFSDFDYLFDGLISEFIHNFSGEQKSKMLNTNVFCTKSFGNNLWLIQIDPETSSSAIDEQVALINNLAGKKFVIVGNSSSKWFTEIPKRYSKFQFQSLN